MPSRSWQVLSSLGDPVELSWLEDSGDPFLQPSFLAALEASGAVGAGTSWEPAHLLFSNHGRPAALLPLYRKSDSRGEYVFDQAWASAYRRHGLAYYPKLVTSIPFTPVPGPRLLLAREESLAAWLPTVLQAVRQECITQSCSGWHGLFVEEDWLDPAAAAGLVNRSGCRFHWTNPGYRDFADFLDTLTSKKRKDIRRERRRLLEQGVQCQIRSGKGIGPDAWEFFYSCYERTYLEHGQHPYLNREFFEAIAAAMPHCVSLVMAADCDGPMASALFFHSDTTLYGRYWGSLRRADGLHFEVCYYQGMELALHLGLKEFDPGTQGEHKLLRGFAPKATYSLHWLREPAFQAAIGRFVSAERREIAAYMKAAEQALPYRQDSRA